MFRKYKYYKMIVIHTAIVLFLVLHCSTVQAESFFEHQDKIYFDGSVVYDLNFDNKYRVLYYFRVENLGEPSLELNRGFINFPFKDDSVKNCKIRDSSLKKGKESMLVFEENEWRLKLPNQTAWKGTTTYDAIVMCECVLDIREEQRGVYVLELDEVKKIFKDLPFFDEGYAIIKLPDSFFHNSVLLNSSPYPDYIIQESGRLSLVFKKDSFVKNDKLFAPRIIVNKVFDWNLLALLLIGVFATIEVIKFIKGLIAKLSLKKRLIKYFYIIIRYMQLRFKNIFHK